MQQTWHRFTTHAVLVLGSCKKMVDEVPLSDGTLDQFFRSKYDVFAANAGMYGAFQQTMMGETQFNKQGNLRAIEALIIFKTVHLTAVQTKYISIT